MKNLKKKQRKHSQVYSKSSIGVNNRHDREEYSFEHAHKPLLVVMLERCAKRVFERSIVTKIFLFFFILLLPTQLGKHFFLPFSYLSGVRVDYLAPTVYVTDIVIVILLFLNFSSFLNFLQNKAVLFFLFLLVLPVIFSVSPFISIYRYVKFFELLFVFFIFWQKIISSPKNLFALTLGASFQLFVSTLQLVNKHSLDGVFYFFGERFLSLASANVAKAALSGVELLRPYGTFSHPNSLAGFYLLLYFFVLAHKKFAPSRLKNFFLILTSALVFISFSKLAITTFILLNLLFLVKNQPAVNCLFCKIVRMIIFLTVGSIFLTATTDPLSLQKRLSLLQNAVDIILKHPLSGTGLGAYLVAQNTYLVRFQSFINQPVHNIFLLFLAETGLLVTITISILFFKKIISLGKKYPYVLAAFLITAFFDHYWLTLQQNFLLLGLVVALL